MESCRYLRSNGYGIFKTASMDEISIDQQKRAFVAVYTATVPSQFSYKKIDTILQSFKITSNTANGISRNDFLNSYFGSGSTNSVPNNDPIQSCSIGNVTYGICPN